VSRAYKGRVVGGKYELVELAGEGGTAAVWRAIKRGAAGFSLSVAVKMIKPQLTTSGEYLKMFVEEARVGSELQHANIVQVHDFGQEKDETYYLVMEWVEGISLRGYEHSHTEVGLRTPWPMIAAIGIEALRGLGAAHERMKDGQPAPVIHRDVSPENLLLGVNGVVKLSDFGFARAKDRLQRITEPGLVKGKVSYLSPEMAAGKPASVASDIFAMGVSLWEALAGKKLFPGEPFEAFRKIMHKEIAPLAPLRPDVPLKLLEAVGRALEPDPEERFAGASEMADALAEVLRAVPRISDSSLGRNVIEARQRLSGYYPTESSLKIDVDIDELGLFDLDDPSEPD
jgi:serine/threonine-protein kinase